MLGQRGREGCRQPGEWIPHGGCWGQGASPPGNSAGHPKGRHGQLWAPERAPLRPAPTREPGGCPACQPQRTPSQAQEGECHQHPANLCLRLLQGTRYSSRTWRGRNRPGREGHRLRSLQCPGEVPCSWEEQEGPALQVTAGGRGGQRSGRSGQDGCPMAPLLATVSSSWVTLKL